MISDKPNQNIKKKYKYSVKTGRPEQNLIGKLYGDFIVTAKAGKIDGVRNYWVLENTKTKELITIRGSNLANFKGKKISKRTRKIKNKK
jgi:hypothetical protein